MVTHMVVGIDSEILNLFVHNKSLSSPVITRIQTTVSKGIELRYNMLLLLQLYQVFPFLNPTLVGLTGKKSSLDEEVSTFTLNSTNYLDCIIYLINRQFNSSIFSFRNNNIPNAGLDKFIRIIANHFRQYLLSQIGYESEIKLSWYIQDFKKPVELEC